MKGPFRTQASRMTLALFLLSTAENLQGGERTDARGMGMARTGVAAARGLDAIGTNPANLALFGDATVAFTLLPLGVHLGSDVLTVDLYRKYFSGIQTDSGRVGVNLNGADKQDILGLFPGGHGRGVVDAEARPLGLAVSLGESGAIAFTISDRLGGSATVPKEYLEFLFYGNPPGSTYNFSGSEGSFAWTREYSFSYARLLPPIPVLTEWYAGISLKLVHGLSYAGIDRLNATLNTSSEGVLDGTVDVLTQRAGLDPTAKDFVKTVRLFPSPAGTGFGVDLGLEGHIGEIIHVGLSVTDLGSISWRKELTERATSGRVHLENPFDRGERDSLDRALRGESKEGIPFTTSLPATLRLGASVELHNYPWFRDLVAGEMTVAAEFAQGLVRSPGGTVVPRGSLGMEYRPWAFLPLRSGISFGGTDGVNCAVGMGIHTGAFDFDLATENLGWIFTPNSAAYGSLAVGMQVRI